MKHSNISKYVTLALLSAIIVVLQLISGYLKIGPVSITLVLVPIVVGAAFYGKGAGAILGGVFGIIVYIGCINVPDFGHILFLANPFMCFLICMVKGCLCGFCAGTVYAWGMKLFAKKKYGPQIAVILAGITAPIVNTAIFCIGVVSVFWNTLSETALENGSSAMAFLFVVLVGVNFFVELGINLVCAPAITTIIRAVKKSR